MNNMTELTNEQWATYEERYGRLMHTISMKISGDTALATHEDNYADLCVAALESIQGFQKKTSLSFDEAIDNKLFDQYTKTVLWNRKAKKGVSLTKRMPFRNSHVSLDIDHDNHLGGLPNLHDRIEDPRAAYDTSAVDLEDFTKAQSENVQKVMNAILKNPALLSRDGSINHSAVKSSTGLSVHHTNKALTQLKNSIKRNYEI